MNDAFNYKATPLTAHMKFILLIMRSNNNINMSSVYEF